MEKVSRAGIPATGTDAAGRMGRTMARSRVSRQAAEGAPPSHGKDGVPSCDPTRTEPVRTSAQVRSAAVECDVPANAGQGFETRGAAGGLERKRPGARRGPSTG